MVGRTLPGGYVILDLIGVGGMGRVYRAEQTNLGRTVAVKIVHPHLVGEENAVARFLTEARAASRLNHPNSVAVIDFDKTPDGQLYLVMEYLRGKDLARVAYEEGPLPFTRIIDVLRQTLAALSEAHHLDIIHRDLKPENVILEPVRAGGDFVKVVDFGLAKMQEASRPSITSPGIVCGTPEYMSPEQGRGDPLDARSDLYAVGVVMYQLLTGRLPFEAESPTQVVLMHLSKAPPDPHKVAPERTIPDVLVDITMKALAKDANDRFSTASEFADALTNALESIGGGAPSRAKLASVKCGKCGAMNALAQKFCGECGSAITGPAITPVAIEAPARTRSAAHALLTAEAPSAIRRASLAVPIFPLPLVGRDDDLAWLEDRRSEARTGLCTARIVAEHGMGKTRILREFLLVAAAAGDTVVATGPDPAWAEVGYYALRKAVISLASLPPDGGTIVDWSAASAEARAGLASLFERPESKQGSLSPDQRRFSAAEALRWALVRANARTRGRRVILSVDDFSSVDGASRNAFVDAVTDPPLVPVLLVITHLPGFEPRWPEGQPQPRILAGLPGSVVAKLVESAGSTGTASVSGRGIAPLYVDQLVRYVREQPGQPPSRLADIIAKRIERLDADARKVLQAIAVIGDDANEDTLLPLLSEDTRFAQAVSMLKIAGMVEEEKGALRTSHPLLRDVVLATIPASVRKTLHSSATRVADMLGAPIEVQALHEFHAQNAFGALLLLERVALRCAARGDVAGNILALRRGLELARRELFRGELDDPMRAVLIFSRKLGEALATAGDLTDADGVLREALDMAGPSGQDRARVLGALAHVAHGRERRKEAQAYLSEALELATKSGSHELVTSLEDLRRAIAV